MVEKPKRLVAHTPPTGGDWHYLDDHALAVADLAATFAEPFGAQDVARWLGLLHDAGKAHPEFQQYLLACAREPGRKHPTVDHKSTGAFLLQSSKDLPQVLLGHHGGLSNLGDVNTRIRELNASQRERMSDAWIRFQSLDLTLPDAPDPTPTWARSTPQSHEFYLRMLFSCLVDADALDTEAHWDHSAAMTRSLDVPNLRDLWTRFRQDQASLMARVEATGQANSPVNRVRAEVYDACVNGASLPPGFFRLTVPTGGGKTRSATAFALRHAILHNLHRVIYAVPFLTITEQTVDVLRDALNSARAVLEHHSGIAPLSESATGEESAEERWRQLATDNWDAPIVVTTTVQLFESLFGRRTRQCRKLHNIAHSVIILDEFQTVPAHLRGPIFDVLKELVTNYGVSVVLCTATQPVLDTIENALAALATDVTELAPNPAHAFAVLDRVRYEWPRENDAWTWERLADSVRGNPRSLTIVNTVRDATLLYERLDGHDAFHLSTRMCGAHRRDVLRTIRTRLAAGEPCRVVSTQLVEAGVDLDFPVVFRAIGPLDRIAQAAGRCNREGRLPDKGRVVVFSIGDDVMPSGAYRHGADVTCGMQREGTIDLRDPGTFDRYFRQLYADRHADDRGIQRYRADRAYKEVADRFRMIDDDTFPVFVNYDEAAIEARDALHRASDRSGSAVRLAFRGIQPFIVSCRSREQARFESLGLIAETLPGFWEWHGDYDEKVGLMGERIDPVTLFI
jgi:CRISPR-associated endonuclease/helicase Cas3